MMITSPRRWPRATSRSGHEALARDIDAQAAGLDASTRGGDFRAIGHGALDDRVRRRNGLFARQGRRRLDRRVLPPAEKAIELGQTRGDRRLLRRLHLVEA